VQVFFLSTNNGATWSAVNNGLPANSQVYNFVASGSNIFASVIGKGLFVSTNNGQSWSSANNGLNGAELVDFAVAGSKLHTSSVPAIFGTSYYGVYNSEDNGASWNLGTKGLPASFYVSTITSSGDNAPSPFLFAGVQQGGIFLSTDYGESWATAVEGLYSAGNIFSLAVSNPNSASPTIFMGSSPPPLYGGVGGIYRSTDIGKSWTVEDNGLTDSAIRPIAISGANTSSPVIFAGSLVGGVYRSSDNGSNWMKVDNGLTSKAVGSLLAVDAQTPSALFAGSFFNSTGGIFLSTTEGSNWNVDDNGLPSGSVPRALASIGPVVFAGTYNSGVFRSTDNGATWSAANTDLGDTDIISFAVSGSNIFAGTNSNGIFLSSNGGQSWSNVSTGLTSSSEILCLQVSGPYLFAGVTGGGVWKRPIAEMITDAVGIPPQMNRLISAYPNPCSQNSTITFSCAETGSAEISVVNLLGQEVERIFSGEISAGEHSFSWDSRDAAPGMYECIVRVNGSVQRIKILCGPK